MYVLIGGILIFYAITRLAPPVKTKSTFQANPGATAYAILPNEYLPTGTFLVQDGAGQAILPTTTTVNGVPVFVKADESVIANLNGIAPNSQ